MDGLWELAAMVINENKKLVAGFFAVIAVVVVILLLSPAPSPCFMERGQIVLRQGVEIEFSYGGEGPFLTVLNISSAKKALDMNALPPHGLTHQCRFNGKISNADLLIPLEGAMRENSLKK